MTRHLRRKGRLVVTVVFASALAALALAPAGEAGQAAGARVTVTFTDSTLRVDPTSPESGPTTIVVHNKGKKPHQLLITGPGLKKGVRTTKITAGRSAQLKIALRPGMYQLSDPVGLGIYSVQFLDIIPSAALTATGNSSVVTTPAPLPPMCGNVYTP
jgi:Cupredoxin-like domain